MGKKGWKIFGLCILAHDILSCASNIYRIRKMYKEIRALEEELVDSQRERREVEKDAEEERNMHKYYKDKSEAAVDAICEMKDELKKFLTE